MSEQEKNWQKFEREKIPSSLNLFPIIFDYLKKNDQILDVGCGFGRICIDLYNKGYKEVYGIDINESGILYARKQISELSQDHLKVANATNIPFDDSQFDFVITHAFWTTVMSEEREAVMKEISRVLKKDGFLYTAQFGQTWEDPLYKKRYEDGLAKGYKRGTFESLDKETGELRYLAYHYTKEEIEALTNVVNFKILYYSNEIFTTQSGNRINGHVLIAQK
ncbi:class I SAM-dependent methyltransferase [candidate division KSB1 bacterium]